MGRSRVVLVAIPLIAALAACSGSPSSTGGSGSTAPASVAASAPASMAASEVPSMVASASMEPSASEMASPSTSAGPNLPSAKPTAVNPCDLVTRDEASALAGVTVAQGKESDLENNGKICVYSVATTLFDVEVVQAPDQATMDAAEQQALTQLQQTAPKGITVGPISGVGDKAELATGSPKLNGVSMNVIGIYFTKGLYFVAISNIGIGHPVATADAMTAQAQTVIGRLP